MTTTPSTPNTYDTYGTYGTASTPNTPDNSDKILTARVNASGRATLVLSYPQRDAEALRKLATSFTVKGRSLPLSLLARRSLQIYSQMAADPVIHGRELQALTEMVTK